MRKKNRKLRRLRELYPGIRIKLFYARDFRMLLLKFGRLALVDELSGTTGQSTPPRVHEALVLDGSLLEVAALAEADAVDEAADDPDRARRARAARPPGRGPWTSPGTTPPAERRIRAVAADPSLAAAGLDPGPNPPDDLSGVRKRAGRAIIAPNPCPPHPEAPPTRP